MSCVNHAAFVPESGIQELNFDEIEAVLGAGEWGENVLAFGGVGGTIGAFVGAAPGAAVGVIVGAVVGTVVTIVDDE